MIEKEISPRIITGSFKGKRLRVPKSTRPVTDRVKQTLFDLLGDTVLGTRFLDLFAGSGNIGIEALSRGAGHVTFVDISQNAVDSIERNVRDLKINKEKYTIVKSEYKKFLFKTAEKFDLIFIDPPFEKFREFNIQDVKNACHQKTLVVLKAPSKSSFIPDQKNINLVEKKIIGINTLYFCMFKKI